MFYYGFMQRAFLASLSMSIIAPIIGLLLILRRQSLMADTLSHVSLAGVALGLLLGINPTWTNIFIIVIIAILLEYLRTIYHSYSELSVALLMSTGMAIALFLMSLDQASTSINITQFLFGSIVTISREQLILLVVLSIIVALLYIIFRKPLYILIFDEDTAFTSGLPVKWMSIIFNTITGITIAVAMPIVGALLVSAIIILPAAIALRISHRFNGVILFGIGISLIGMNSGLIISYQIGSPPGASITLSFITMFIITLVLKALLTRFIPSK